MHKTITYARSVHKILFYIGVLISLNLPFGRSHVVSESLPPTFVDVCHEGSITSVNINALSGHLSHGDVQLIDEDGDGYYTEANDCGMPVDCDDSDAMITTCGTIIALGNPHPTYGGIVFEVNGSGGGKLVSLPAIQGINFGYVDIQHDTPWTTSSSDGATNTAALALVHPFFDPIRLSTSKGVEWYLPSIDELEEIYKTVFANGIAPDEGIYLSSTDAGSSRIKAYYFHLTDAKVIEYSHFGTGAYTLTVRSF